MNTKMIVKILLTLPVIGLCGFFVSQYDRGFVGFDKLTVIDITVPIDGTRLTANFTDASLGWLKTRVEIEFEKTAGFATGPAEYEKEVEKDRHGNSVFEDRYLVTGIVFVVCCGLTVVMSVLKALFSHKEMNNVYSVFSVLQIVFSLGIVATSWAFVGLAYNDKDFERRALEYQDLLIAEQNGEEVPFGTGKQAQDIFEIKWVPITALVMTAFILITEAILLICCMIKKKQSTEPKVEVELNNV